MFTADELHSIIAVLEMYCLECDIEIRRMEHDIEIRRIPDHDLSDKYLDDLSDKYLELDYHNKYLSHVKSITDLVRSKLSDIDVPCSDDCLPF